MNEVVVVIGLSSGSLARPRWRTVATTWPQERRLGRFVFHVRP